MVSSRLARFLKLPAEKRKMYLTAFTLHYIIRIALWTLSYSCIKRMLHRITVNPEVGTISAEEVVQSVEVTSKFVLNATCLTKALAAKMLLARRGYSSNLLIGVDASNGFAAHAWIERDGTVIMGGSICEYKPLYELE